MRSAAWLATSSARGAYESVAKNVNQTLGAATAGTQQSQAAQQASRCGCLDRVYYLVTDAVGLSSPEDKRRREFERAYMATLEEGIYVTLVDFDEPEKVSLMGSVSRSVTSFLGTGRAPGAAGASSTASGAHPASGSQVLLRLVVADDGIRLEWQTLQQQQNRPLHEGALPLRAIQVFENGSSTELRLLDHHAKLLFAVEMKTSQERDLWHAALKEAQAVLAPQLEEEASRSRSIFDRQQRYLELEQRKRDRDRKKQALGSVGMQFTAQAMAKQ